MARVALTADSECHACGGTGRATNAFGEPDGDTLCVCVEPVSPPRPLVRPDVPHAAATRRALAKIRAWGPDEARASLVSSGILTPEGELAPEYGGPVSPPAPAPSEVVCERCDGTSWIDARTLFPSGTPLAPVTLPCPMCQTIAFREAYETIDRRRPPASSTGAIPPSTAGEDPIDDLGAKWNRLMRVANVEIIAVVRAADALDRALDERPDVPSDNEMSDLSDALDALREKLRKERG